MSMSSPEGFSKVQKEVLQRGAQDILRSLAAPQWIQADRISQIRGEGIGYCSTEMARAIANGVGVDGQTRITAEQIQDLLGDIIYGETGTVDVPRVVPIRAAFRGVLNRNKGVPTRRDFHIQDEGGFPSRGLKSYWPSSDPRFVRPADYNLRDQLGEILSGSDNCSMVITGGNGIKFDRKGGPKSRRNIVQGPNRGQLADLVYGEKFDNEGFKRELAGRARAILSEEAINDEESLVKGPATVGELITILRNGFGGASNPLYVLFKKQVRGSFFNQFFRKDQAEMGVSAAEIERTRKQELADFVFAQQPE